MAALERALDVVVVPDLIDRTVLALEGDGSTVLALESGLDVGEVVALGSMRSNAGIREPLVGRAALEERDSLVKVGNSLLLGLVVGVAGGFQSGNASTVLGPLVRPELLVIAIVVLPVGVHVRESCRGSRENVLNVGVGAVRVARGGISAITVIRPKTVNSPGV